MTDIPLFEDAARQFREFLEREGFVGDLLWIFREDVAVDREGRVSVRLPLPSENPDRARAEYERGRQGGIGVHLSVFCSLESKPCCFVWVPQTERDAESAMVSGLKLSAPKSPRTARAFKESLANRVLTWLGSDPQGDPWLEELPRRSS